GPSPLAWSEIPSTNRPSARSGATGLLDPGTATLRIVGGNVNQPDMWSLPLAGGSWTQLAFEVPVGNQAQRFTDPVRHRFVLHGGGRANTPRPLDDTWALDPTVPGGTWNLLGPAVRGSGPRGRALAFQDPPRDRFVLFGGLPPAYDDPAPPFQLALGQ